MTCEHDNCYTCPYPDCISGKGPKEKPVKKKPGRKKLPREELLEHHRQYARQYYNAHKEKYREYYMKYSSRKTQSKPLASRYIWVTDGKINKAISPDNYEDWKNKGWRRGRTANWRKDK